MYASFPLSLSLSGIKNNCVHKVTYWINPYGIKGITIAKDNYLDKFKISDLNEANDGCNDHEGVDDCVTHIDDQDCNQVKLLLIY